MRQPPRSTKLQKPRCIVSLRINCRQRPSSRSAIAARSRPSIGARSYFSASRRSICAAGPGRAPRQGPGQRQGLIASAKARAGEAPSDARDKRMRRAITPPASTGARRNVQGSPETTSSGLIPAGGMKRICDIHRQHRKSDRCCCCPGLRSRQAEHNKSDQRRNDVPTYQRSRLGRLHLRRTDDEHNGGGERDKGQRILNRERRPLHPSNGERNAKAGGSRLRRIGMNHTAARLAVHVFESRPIGNKIRGRQLLCRPLF